MVRPSRKRRMSSARFAAEGVASRHLRLERLADNGVEITSQCPAKLGSGCSSVLSAISSPSSVDSTVILGRGTSALSASSWSSSGEPPLGRKRPPPGQQSKEKHSQLVDIGGSGDGLASDLFGAGVIRGEQVPTQCGCG